MSMRTISFIEKSRPVTSSLNAVLKQSWVILTWHITCGQRLKGLYSTLPYCAPEVYGDEAYDALAIDIWSLGVLFFLMVSWHLPFQGNYLWMRGNRPSQSP